MLHFSLGPRGCFFGPCPFTPCVRRCFKGSDGKLAWVAAGRETREWEERWSGEMPVLIGIWGVRSLQRLAELGAQFSVAVKLFLPNCVKLGERSQKVLWR